MLAKVIFITVMAITRVGMTAASRLCKYCTCCSCVCAPLGESPPRLSPLLIFFSEKRRRELALGEGPSPLLGSWKKPTFTHAISC